MLCSSRYFSPNLARLAGDAMPPSTRGGQRREIATLFTDIASFTALVETLEPDVLAPLLNEYFDRHDRDRLRARRNRGENHRRCDPCAVRRAGRATRRFAPSD